MDRIVAATRDAGGKRLTVVWSDGRRESHAAAWLRDNAPDPQTRDPGNGQRRFDITALAGEIAIAEADLDGDGAVRLRFAPDGHFARFAAADLRAPAGGAETRTPARRLWHDPASLSPPLAPWPAVRDDPARRLAWLEGLARDGIARVRGLPARDGALFELVGLFGQVRETNYGRLFDVRIAPDPINLAYTGLGLGPHTDNPYREPVPGLQVLHCLTSDADGGESLVVDGLAAAAALAQAAPDQAETLATVPATFRFADGDCELIARVPILERDAGGAVVAVRFNTRSFVAPEGTVAEIERFYGAYRAFGALLRDPARQARFALAPGDAFIVDNRRVLHGRTAFHGGERHLQGCYGDQDGLYSTIAVLRRRQAARTG